MNDIERFDFELGHDGYVYVDPYGSYVLFADYEKLQQQLADAREALRELHQACWDARAAMGFDNDGAPTPAALAYPTMPELILRDCREFRKEHDEVCNENTKLERDARAWRNRFIDERMNAYPNDCYEMQRCYAESDANEFIKAFHAATL